MTIPEAVVRHVLEGHADHDALTLHCRSDMGSCRAPAQPVCPEVWLVAYRASQPLGWRHRLRALLSSQVQPMSSETHTSELPPAKRQKLTDGICIKNLGEGVAPVTLPQGSPLLIQRLQSSTSTSGRGEGEAPRAAGGSSPPRLLVVEHHVTSPLPDQDSRRLAELGAALKAAHVPLLVTMLPGSGHTHDKLPLGAANECARTYGVPEHHILFASQSIEAIRDDQVSHAELAMSEVRRLRIAMFWMVMQGTVPQPAASKL